MRKIQSRMSKRAESLSELLGWSEMALWKRRTLKTVLGVILLVVLTSVAYHYIMIRFENRSPSFMHSMQVVIETYTGTGYGSDSPWESTISHVFVSTVDLSTFLLVFIILPYVFTPVLEETLSPTVPTETDLTDHVVVCGLAHQGDRLITELEARNVPYVIVTDSESDAIEFMEAGRSVIHGDPTSVETLKNANVTAADSIVVDTTAKEAASIVLAAGELSETIETIVLVEDLEYKSQLEYAGVDQVLTPRHLVGQRIAERIVTEINPAKSDTLQLGENLSALELTVFENSPIDGKTIHDIETLPENEITVVGIWTGGEFVPAPDAETTVDAGAAVVVVGETSDVEALETTAYRGREHEPMVVIAGHGLVGSTARDTLESADIPCTVIDIETGDEIDVVGDATSETALLQTGIEDATAFVVALADDDEAILSILLANKLTDDLDTTVRMNNSENARKMRRAGAEYVLGLSDISGRILAQEVLDEEVLSYSRQLKIVRIDGTEFAGRQLGETEMAKTGCIVVAVDRGGTLITELNDTFEIRVQDSLLVVGQDDDIDEVERILQS